MNKLPKVIISSVIRTAHKGNSHGGIYIVDLETEKTDKVVDWNDPDINWDGRGGERGMRGIVFYKNKIITSSATQILFFSRNFDLIQTVETHIFKGIHEIYEDHGILYITSSSQDSIVLYDLNKNQFKQVIKLKKLLKSISLTSLRRRSTKQGYYIENFKTIDLNREINLSDNYHINNVYVENNRIYFSGTRLNQLFLIKNGRLKEYANVPFGTHNCRPFNNGFLCCDTINKRILHSDFRSKPIFEYDVPEYSLNELSYTHLTEENAKQGFARGLCVYDNLIINGSSPATITVYDCEKKEIIKSICITKDIRNSIHGLEVYPY